MKNPKHRYCRALALTMTLLSAGAAVAQLSTSTNTLRTNDVYALSSANTSEPGITWNVSQVASPNPGSIAFAEGELAGEEGPNLADPTQVYSSASANGTVPSNPDLPIAFPIPGSINFSIAGPGDAGDARPDLPPEDGMVGTPGSPADAAGGQDNIAAEGLTYLSLPQGQTIMGVRSDDGFQLQIGAANPGDRYSTNAPVVVSFPGTRSKADNIVTLNVPKAGLYAARLLYYQAGGNASVEWYSFPPAGSTNSFLGTNNTGTNAVLVGDVADGGIACYRAVTGAAVGSYVSSLSPSPGSTGVALLPTVTATIVNGAVAVSGITLTIDGTAVTPTVTTTATGASITWTATNLLAGNLLTHTLVLSWNDNGTVQSVKSTFSVPSYITLSPSQIVTPDTTKPGFKFNIFANASDPLVASTGGVQGGETDFLDNIELGLNGIEPDGTGGFLPNQVTLSANGAAVGPAPALGGSNAPAEFVIAGTLDLSGGNIPGSPGGAPSHSEALTYIHLPVGLTTFTLNLDGWYRAFAGSWDYTLGQEAGGIFDEASGDTSFSVVTTQAGYYPFRITVFNTDGSPQESLYSTATNGTLVLVNDVAHGGLPAYYALSTPSKPYIRYTSPRPVMHQMLFPNNRLLVRLQNRDTTVTASSAALNVDGNNVTVTKNQVGDVLEMTWTPTTLQTTPELHTSTLTYQDSGANSVSSQWTFMNLKAIFLPVQTAGTWTPINAVAIEDFSEYADPTVFTNNPPTNAYVQPPTAVSAHFVGAPVGPWYQSPQPENPLVDTCPIWTNIPAGPKDWFVWNWDGAQGTNSNNVNEDLNFDDTDAGSAAYANFLCVDLMTFSGIEGDSVNTDVGQTINGQPLTQLIDPSKHVLIAESDNRVGNPGGQTQFGVSKAFDLSSVANPVIAWANIKKQNQDDLAAFEYSVDGGATWAPIQYSFDGHSLGSDPPDLQLNLDQTVNINNTFFHDLNPGEVPFWTDSSGDFNDTYAAGVAAPITQALAPFMAPRINDDGTDGKRLEVVRLPLAAHKSNVRLRIGQLGTCSWYYGIGEIAFYDIAPSGAVVPTGLPSATGGASTLSISVASGNVNVTWTGSGTLQSATGLTGNASDWSNVSPAPTTNSYSAPVGHGNLFFRIVSQ